MNIRLGEKNPTTIALISLAVIAIVVTLAVNAGSLAFWRSTHHYEAYLENASGLSVSDSVQIHGVRVGEVDDISVEGNQVLVRFTVNDHTLGENSTAAVKVLNPLGTGYFGVTPDGPGELAEPIPTGRTTPTMTLLGDLGEVSERVRQLDVAQLREALDVTSSNLSAASSDAISDALSGLAEFSGTLAERADDLDRIVTEGSSLAEILADRKDGLVNLISQGDVLLDVLKDRRENITELLNGSKDLSHEVAAILDVNEDKLNPMLRDLQNISEILAEENDNISAAIPALRRVSEHMSAATGNGPFLDVVVPTGLLPDSLLEQCDDGSFPDPDNPVVGCRP